MNESLRERIAAMQSELDSLRRAHNISDRGEVLYLGESSAVDDERVVVEADGLGGAVLKVVEGNYPIDYLTISEQSFATEMAAEEAAEAIAV